MNQDFDQGTTDMATEAAGAATDVSVQRDLQSNTDNASTAPFENADPGGTAAVTTGNFPDSAYTVDDPTDEATADGSA